MVGLAVLPHQSGPVHPQHHVELVDGHVVDEHVIGALEEAGIDGEHGDRALLGHSGGHRDGAALGDAHVEEALRESGLELGKARAAHHGGGDGAHPPVLLGQLGEGAAKDGGEVLPRLLFGLARGRVEGGHAVKGVRVLLRRGIALALHRFHVEQHRLVQLPGIAQGAGQAGQVVAVHRPHIVKAHVLEHAAGQQALLQGLLYLVCKAIYLAAYFPGVHHTAIVPLKGEVLGLQPLPGQMVGHRPHVCGDGHAVVVQNDQQLLAAGPGVGQPLIGQTAGEGAVANEGHDLIVLPQSLARPDHA